MKKIVVFACSVRNYLDGDRIFLLTQSSTIRLLLVAVLQAGAFLQPRSQKDGMRRLKWFL